MTCQDTLCLFLFPFVNAHLGMHKSDYILSKTTTTKITCSGFTGEKLSALFWLKAFFPYLFRELCLNESCHLLGTHFILCNQALGHRQLGHVKCHVLWTAKVVAAGQGEWYWRSQKEWFIYKQHIQIMSCSLFWSKRLSFMQWPNLKWGGNYCCLHITMDVHNRYKIRHGHCLVTLQSKALILQLTFCKWRKQ